MRAWIRRRHLRGCVPACIALLAVLVLTVPAAADAPGEDDTIAVILDQARLVKLPDRVSTVVVGNPLIADISIQSGGLMVVTGKGYGITNLVALDRSGATLFERLVQVKGPFQDTVVVYRGIDRETYSCAPFCERRVTIGDAQTYFGQTLGQTGTWLGQIQGAAQLGSK